jgi:prenyltransferase beta subunit
MIVVRIIDPASKLATAHGLSTDTCNSTLCEILKVQDADADELYEAMDWLAQRQAEIKQRIADLGSEGL